MSEDAIQESDKTCKQQVGWKPFIFTYGLSL